LKFLISGAINILEDKKLKKKNNFSTNKTKKAKIFMFQHLRISKLIFSINPKVSADINLENTLAKIYKLHSVLTKRVHT